MLELAGDIHLKQNISSSTFCDLKNELPSQTSHLLACQCAWNSRLARSLKTALLHENAKLMTGNINYQHSCKSWAARKQSSSWGPRFLRKLEINDLLNPLIWIYSVVLKFHNMISSQADKFWKKSRNQGRFTFLNATWQRCNEGWLKLIQASQCSTLIQNAFLVGDSKEDTDKELTLPSFAP